MVETKCAKCNSKEFKKTFLGMPRFFGMHPVCFALLVIFGGAVTVIHGAVKSQHALTNDWLFEMGVGAIVILVGILGLASKNFKCSQCGERFYRLPMLYSTELTASDEVKTQDK